MLLVVLMPSIADMPAIKTYHGGLIRQCLVDLHHLTADGAVHITGSLQGQEKVYRPLTDIRWPPRA